MNLAYILTGSNLGVREAHMYQAKQLLENQCGTITVTSSLYETAAWGNEEQPAFLNQALALSTNMTARQLIRAILKIEKQMGRIRQEKYGPRIIDIDILLFNDEIHDYHLLQLPHPEMNNRRFALTPMAEIAPHKIHPVSKLSIQSLLYQCKDPLAVRIYS